VDQEARSLISMEFCMNQAMYHFSELFAQLGLPSEPGEVIHFLTTHRSMSTGFRLPDAPYWTPSQASFLRESLMQDSDCSDVVDQLSGALQGMIPSAAIEPGT
jgi:hypothetical protein